MLEHIELQVTFTNDGKYKDNSVKASVSRSIPLNTNYCGFGNIEVWGEAYGEDAEEALIELKRIFIDYPCRWVYDSRLYNKINEEVGEYKKWRHLYGV